jgi:ribosomal protein S18 acetylase RimI-like enzyme
MKFEIVKAAKNDIQEIQELNLNLFRKEFVEYDNSLNLSWTKGEIGTNYFARSVEHERACSLVARVDGEVVGYLVGWIKNRKNPCRTIGVQAELENMFVVKDFRNNGIGTALVQAFLKWAKSKGIRNIRVGVYSANDRARRFYQSLGFEDKTSILEVNI